MEQNYDKLDLGYNVYLKLGGKGEGQAYVQDESGQAWAYTCLNI